MVIPCFPNFLPPTEFFFAFSGFIGVRLIPTGTQLCFPQCFFTLLPLALRFSDIEYPTPPGFPYSVWSVYLLSPLFFAHQLVFFLFPWSLHSPHIHHINRCNVGSCYHFIFLYGFGGRVWKPHFRHPKFLFSFFDGNSPPLPKFLFRKPLALLWCHFVFFSVRWMKFFPDETLIAPGYYFWLCPFPGITWIWWISLNLFFFTLFFFSSSSFCRIWTQCQLVLDFAQHYVPHCIHPTLFVTSLTQFLRIIRPFIRKRTLQLFLQRTSPRPLVSGPADFSFGFTWRGMRFPCLFPLFLAAGDTLIVFFSRPFFHWKLS